MQMASQRSMREDRSPSLPAGTAATAAVVAAAAGVLVKRLMRQRCAHAASPQDFACPLSNSRMLDPIVATNGETYDRFTAFKAIDEKTKIPGCATGTFKVLGELLALHPSIFWVSRLAFDSNILDLEAMVGPLPLDPEPCSRIPFRPFRPVSKGP